MWQLTSVYLIWIDGKDEGNCDDEDDGGCGEAFFFPTLLFSKENRTKNPCSIHSLNSFVGGFLGPVYMEVGDPR